MYDAQDKQTFLSAMLTVSDRIQIPSFQNDS